MTNLVEQRADIQLEETQFEAGVSEGTWTKLGKSVNFINRRHFERHSWNLNGSYFVALGSGKDGLFVLPFDMEITGLSMSNVVNGSSGTTTIDIHWFDAPASDQGTIFSVKPSISSSAGNNAFLARNLVDGNTQTGTGLTLPTFSKTQFNQFDALRLDLDTAMNDAQDLNVTIFFRPR